MKKQTILFDLDDTLIHCNKYFMSTIDRFAGQMKDWFAGHGFSAKDFKKKQLELDLAGVHIHGFMRNRFPESLVETYEYYSEYTGRRKKSEEVRQLFRLGQSVYDQHFEPYPHMEETLEKLSHSGHTLYLYTGGDEAVQHKKIRQMQLERFFEDRVFVTAHKTVDFLSNLLDQSDIDRSAAWMIGNSPRTDIVPALQAGISAIYIPAQKEWEYNQVEINVEPKGAFFTLSSLPEVPVSIERYLLNQK